MNRFVSLAVLVLLIGLLGGLLYQVLAPFLLPLFLAAVLAVICQPLHNFFLRKTNHRTSWAAALTTATLVAILVIPIVIGTFISAVQLYTLADQHLNGDWHSGLDLMWNRVVTPTLERIEHVAPSLLSDEPIEDLKVQIRDSLQSLATQIAARTFQIASSTVGLFVSLSVAAGMLITALYYFLADGPQLIAAAEELIPLPVDHQRRLRERFATVVRAVVTATFMAAFVQGFATAIAIWCCGIGYFWIFLAIATVASLIPLIGAWIVWVPCAAWLALQGHYMAAALLSVWGIAVVSMLDNIVKIYVLQNDADLHPLLAFISVVGALQVLGLWGIFIGPIMASCLFALLQIFNMELKELTKDRQVTGNESPPPVAPSASILSEAEPRVATVAVVQAPVSVMTGAAISPTKTKQKRRR